MKKFLNFTFYVFILSVISSFSLMAKEPPKIGGKATISVTVGFTALAEAFGKIALDAEQVGRYFHSVDQAYKKGGYRYDIENDILLPIPGAVIEKIDLSQGVIEIGSQKIYSSKH